MGRNSSGKLGHPLPLAIPEALYWERLQVGSQVLARGMGQLIPDDKDRLGLPVKTPPIGLEDLLAWEGNTLGQLILFVQAVKKLGKYPY